jgi:hypothetical protein
MPSTGLVVFSISTLIACGCAVHRAPSTPDDDFARAVREYVEMRAEAVRTGGGVRATADAAELTGAVDALAARIQQLRAGFDQGVLFPPTVARRIRLQLDARLHQPDASRIRAELADVDPVPTFAPRINGRYPAGTARLSTPAALLQVLPPLPVVLSYRFVGRDLLLLDRNTDVILDVIDDALPPPQDAEEE